MDLLVCYWSEVDSGVKMKCLTLIMFVHAKVQDLLTEILKALKEISHSCQTSAFSGMDGPNMNNSILIKLNEIKKEKGYQLLVKCPPSSLIHVCHNRFKKGFAKYGYTVEELCLNLYYSFKRNIDDKTCLK